MKTSDENLTTPTRTPPLTPVILTSEQVREALETRTGCGAHFSDTEVSGRIRMLMRSDLDHEAVCTMARDRIRDLSEKQSALCRSHEALRAQLAERNLDLAQSARVGIGHMERVAALRAENGELRAEVDAAKPKMWIGNGEPKYGDAIVNQCASMSNPLRTGYFVRSGVRAAGKMNPGKYYELTDKKGRFWEISATSECLSFAALSVQPKSLSEDPTTVGPSPSLESGKDELPLVYFDMDGVLADFDKAYDERIGYRKPNGDVFWDQVNACGDFFLKLQELPYARLMWDAVPPSQRRILSSIAKSVDVCDNQKRTWLNEHFPLPGEHMFLVRGKSHKKAYAKPGHILVDDWHANIKDWREAGGIGVHVSDGKQALAELSAALSPSRERVKEQDNGE